jgi:hypothetical protein
MLSKNNQVNSTQKKLMAMAKKVIAEKNILIALHIVLSGVALITEQKPVEVVVVAVSIVSSIAQQ